MQLRMIHAGASRDSLVTPADRQTFDLMLVLRLQLIRREPSDNFDVLGTRCNGDGILHNGHFGNFTLTQWTPAEWAAFRSNVVPIIMRYCDRKFALTPTRPWYQPRSAGAAVAARFTCSLSLQLVDTAGHAHQRYNIIKPQETTFRSFADGAARRGLSTHRDLGAHPARPTDARGHGRPQRQLLPEHDPARVRSHTRAAARQRKRQWSRGVWNDAGAASPRHGHRWLGLRPWISQLRHHLIRAHGEAPLTFTARIVAPQLITYWDNDWVPPPAAAP
jgi:hypothetical protein